MRRGDRVGRGDRRGAWAARGLTAMTACVLTLGACTSPLAEVVGTSGPLADGFEIERGSTRIGPVFPHASGEGNQVILGVDGDMERVFAGYARQAKALGYPISSVIRNGEPQWCGEPDGRPAGDPFETQCSVYTSEPEGPMLLLHGVAESDGGGYIHLVTGSNELLRSSVTDGPAAPVTDVEVARLSPYVDLPLRLVEGSELLFDPIPTRCDAGSFIAILRVTGDLVSVLRGYRERFDESGFTTEALMGDEEKPRLWGGLAGGGDLTAAGARGDPSFILVERCITN